MIKVAHIMHSYLRQSETFIWQYLHRLQRVTPVIIAKSLENLDQFSVPGASLYQTSGPRFTRLWIIDNWYRRMLKKPLGYTKKIIQKENADVIHAHFGTIGSTFLPLSLSLNIPLATSFYGFDLSMKDVIERNEVVYQQLFVNGTYFLVEGPFMKQKLTSLGCPEEKIIIQRIALDLEQYKFRRRAWDGKRPIRLLFVGRFVEKKGLEYALRALAKVKNIFPFLFNIIGYGPLEEELRSLASALGFKNEINWLGGQSHEKVIEELYSCDSLLQPSVTARNGDSEGGAPTIILEAQACGVPVISTSHADIPYITYPKESALLSPERDVDGLANNIRSLFDHSELWHHMGRKGREHIEKFHDVVKEVVALEAIYKRSLLHKGHVNETILFY